MEKWTPNQVRILAGHYREVRQVTGYTSPTAKTPGQIRAERREEIRQQVRDGLLTEAEGEAKIAAL